MTPEFDPQPLAAGLAELSVDLSAATQQKLIDFVALLGEWNQRFNLTAIRDPQAMIPGHLLDSLVVLSQIHGKRLVDVGSGAGLPGIPLALARPELAVLLIDSNGKKISFLREAKDVLGLPNVNIWRGRVEDYPDRAAFDTVVCRAFAPLPRLLKLVAPLCAPKGRILALKGPNVASEADGAPAKWDAGWQTRIDTLTVPGLERERRLVTLTRSASPTKEPKK